MNYEEMLKQGNYEAILEKVSAVCKTKLELRGFNSYTMERDDVVQEVMIRVFNNLGNFDPSKAKLSTFIETIIDNRITDCFRTSNTHTSKLLSSAISISSVVDQQSRDEEASNLDLGSEDNGYAIADFKMLVKSELSPTEQKVVYLMSGGYMQNEIAEVVKFTPARVCQIVKNVRKKVANIA